MWLKVAMGLEKSHRRASQLVCEDADTLFERFGGQAYYQALQLSLGREFDESGKLPEHWGRVKHAIARHHTIDTTISGLLQWE